MDKEWIFIGVDVSKYTLDLTAITSEAFVYHQIENKPRAVVKYLHKFCKKLLVEEDRICMGIENTGRYSWPALTALSATEVHLYLLSPLHLKLSMGMVRGKNDVIDSKRIALFLAKNKQGLTPYKAADKSLQQLSLLLSRRNKLKKQLMAESSTKEDLFGLESNEISSFIEKQSRAAIAYTKKLIEELEVEIEKLIKANKQLQHKMKLATSVPGVGKVLGWYLLVKTNAFENIADPRKLACYAGVAPFEHSSGISVRGRTRVSPFADKQLKKILHMAALRVTHLDGEMQEYFKRKVAEGKNKMSVINALRNKIIHRVMAVIREDRPYQNNYNNHLAMS